MASLTSNIDWEDVEKRWEQHVQIEKRKCYSALIVGIGLGLTAVFLVGANVCHHGLSLQIEHFFGGRKQRIAVIVSAAALSVLLGCYALYKRKEIQAQWDPFSKEEEGGRRNSYDERIYS